MSGSLESAENQYKAILEGFFLSKYDEKALPSHGISHHRRVWKYAKELAPVLAAHHGSADPANSASLLIACYLHDIGMLIEPGSRHGIHSAELCREFLALNNLSESDFSGLLPAILNHDNKDYGSNPSSGDLFTLLSISDDLDAFGFIGVYRYLEIYMKRGMSLPYIGKAVRNNAFKRFEHFKQKFSFDSCIVEKHKRRYELLENFFDVYDRQLSSGSVYSSSSGHRGVVNLLTVIINSEEETLKMFQEACITDDPAIKWFFEGLIAEI